MKGGSMRAIVVVLPLVISLSVAAQSDWAVQTSSDICVWAAPSVGSGVAERIEEILHAVEDYWIPDPLPAACTPPQTSPLSIYFGPSEVPLATIALYSDAESMRRDLDRFDADGLATAYSSVYDYGLRPTAFLDRLPEDAIIQSLSLLYVCCDSDDDWGRIAAHELVHALQLTQWDVDSTSSAFPYFDILQEGTARHTEYALGYLDRFDLRTAGPVSIWLAESDDLHEAPEFLLYEIGASLVDALVRRAPPDVLWSALSGPCRSTIWNWLYTSWGGFGAAFADAYGLSWDAFLDAWVDEASAVDPPPGSQHVYRWLRDAYGLRATLLAPLLDEDQQKRIEAVAEAVYLGTAGAADLDEIDGVLRAANGGPTPEVLEALHEREGTVIEYARGYAGAVGEVADVLRQGILARKGETPADDYVRAFVDVVNAYVPIAVRRPIIDPWW
jgi:hypothetical protein